MLDFVPFFLPMQPDQAVLRRSWRAWAGWVGFAPQFSRAAWPDPVVGA